MEIPLKMSNFEDILIILFILFSIISAFFSKKKEQKKRAQKTKVEPESNLDIFEFFQPKEEGKSEVDAYFEQFSEKDYKRIPEKKESEASLQLESNEVKDAKELEKLKWQAVKKPIPVEIPLKKPEKQTRSRLNKKAARIRKNIKKPDSLREYILMSEILNKPLALRD